MDWPAFEGELTAGVVEKVTEAAGTGGRLYAAVLGELYAETDGVIRLPMLGANSEEALAGDEDVRWCLADWDTVWHPWLPEERWEFWERTLTEEACRSSVRHWERTFARYLTTLTRVCKRAREQLRAKGVTHQRFVVVVLTDDDAEEGLLRRVLGGREMHRLFPAYDEAAAWTAEMEALTPRERAVHYLRALSDRDGPVACEELEKDLCALGQDAAPALIDALAQGPDRWQAAKLLADIGDASEEVIQALSAALRNTTGPDQSWAAVALSRLGGLDVVLSAGALADDVVVSAVAAPFTSFRDHAVSPPPLDYRPLTHFLDTRPELSEALHTELRPGSSFCTLRAEEVGAAVDALRSSHAVVRRHAVCVLAERSLGAAVGRRVIPLLTDVMADDPDATTRRLAVLSLHWWKHDAHLRQALHDPDPGVRAAAQHCLDEN
ncbi:HEAT repeat domain-containing protein [Streptomyces mesophilus]|uniref:HEAT repeat domain-containing protein n=1 Tax=Streptomyces mesophilus TaxID=1775132 RepID=UPI00331D3E37